MTDEKKDTLISSKGWNAGAVFVFCFTSFTIGFLCGVAYLSSTKFSKGVDTIVSVKEDMDKVKQEYGDGVKEIADGVKEKGAASIKAVSAEEIGKKGSRAVEDVIEDATKTFRDVTSALRDKVKIKKNEKE